MTKQNLVAMKLTQETEDKINAKFDEIDALMVGSINLGDADRKGLTWAGARSDRYVRGTNDLANQNPGLIPRDADLEGFNDDLESRDRMLRISSRANKLAERCNDTTLALGSDLMVMSNFVYAILKVHGKQGGLDDALKDLGYRFARRTKKKPEPTDE